MNRLCTRFVFATLLVGATALAHAVPMRADLSVTTDESDGRSFDADFSISPSEHLTLNAGAGHSGGSDKTADLSGTLLNGGVSLHGDRAGVALAYDRFDDSSNYRSATLGARGWVTAGDFEFALLAKRRDMSVQLTLALPNRTLTRDEDFSALGAGLQVSFARGNFTAYALDVEYDYDDDFDRFLALTQSAQIARRPLIEALVGSFITQAQGAIDRQSGAGIEQTFGRHSLALDVSSVHDAITDTGSMSVALTWRYTQSARLDVSLSGGMVDSDQYGDIGFLGVAVGLGN
jgi:hypothetical protein